MTEIKVKRLNNLAILPSKQTEGSAGYDIYSCIDEEIVLKPLDRALISTGISIELPLGFEAQIRPRSGLAIKNGITLLNTPGTIDSDYRGEIKIILVNLSDKDFTIENNMRIAQMVISKLSCVKLVEAEMLSGTLRGEGGFGSTGV
jgi:dUTP pyrophosphatase